MTITAANEAIDRMEADPGFGERVKDAGEREGPGAALAILRSEGFEVTEGEMRDVMLDRFGDQFTPEQLDAVSGGADTDALREWAIGLGSAAAGAVVATVGLVAASAV
jgi:predicted ribosomally synthesized peptide with nif11-like leader